MDGPLPVTLVLAPRFSLVSLAICIDGLRIANRESVSPVFHCILASEDGANLLTAYRRAANIVRIEEKKDGRRHGGEAEEALLQAGEETALHAALTHASHAAEETLAREDYAAAMHGLSGLRQPVDAFFDEVLVNVEEAAVRENRLRLLSQIVGTLDRVADFSQIEGA